MRYILLTLTIFFHLYGESFEEQKAKLDSQGYVWIKNFYSPEQVDLLDSWSEDIYNSAITLLELSESSGLSLQHFAKTLTGALIVVPEASNDGQICRTEDMLSCFPELYHFIYGSLTCYLSRMLEEPYTLFKDKLNFKWPNGGAFAPHQDFPAYSNFSQNHITAMVCIDDATIENGCLYVAKDWKGTFSDDEVVGEEIVSNGAAVLPYIVGGKMHGAIEKRFVDKITWIPITSSKGDVIFFNSFLPHYSEINRSQSSRRAMFFTHNPLKEGDHRSAYYYAKREDPDNPVFHFATPTKARMK